MASIRQMIKQLEKRRGAIGRERDKLRDILGEWSDLADNCDTAYEDIDHAIDTLSQHA